MQQKELLTKKETANIGEEISHEMAADFITSFEKAYPTENKWFCMGKNILEQILAQPGCAGIRFYNGINEKGQKTLVYVGMDAAGNDIMETVVVDDRGMIATTPAIVADRNGSWLELIIGIGR
jgi:hypothetical protein